ncbi:MAG: aminodeoxychorismate synthase component [Verrucomicrobiota bacterium]|jgi:para-aminobenzoate synthetase/4-amino-4-deoxychorismate lyase
MCLLRSSRSSTGWLRLSGGGELLLALTPEEVRPLIRRIEAEAAAGKWLAGWLAYEAAAVFEPSIPVHHHSGPLAVFGIFERADEVRLEDLAIPAPEGLPRWTPLVNAETQQRALTELKAAIFAGELYQANLSFRCAVTLGTDSPLALFKRLYQAQAVPFAAWFELGPYGLISLSPELFLQRRGSRLTSLPMKGTCPRAASWEEDEARRRWLAQDPKSQAENVMIVDLMRNDLSRICRENSVQVDSLFQVDRYATLHQMVSQVSGELKPGASLESILEATFPPGSVTGAPKIQACSLIRRLEQSPRGAYTGIAGWVEPGGDFTFNVCIRTLEKQGKIWSLGLGSGVVADSSPSLEWQECLLKGAFLRAEALPEELFTTMAWENGRPLKLRAHLRRLRDSCRWFQRPFPGDAIFAQLRQWRIDRSSGAFRVRLAVDAQGQLRGRCEPLAALGWGKDEALVVIAEEKIPTANPWTRHKTSCRGLYERALARAKALGADEALLFNDRNELAEGSFTSIFLCDSQGHWFTPPLEAGILPGIWRQEQIQILGAIEKALTLDDLHAAAKLRLGNSLRGGIPARIRA